MGREPELCQTRTNGNYAQIETFAKPETAAFLLDVNGPNLTFGGTVCAALQLRQGRHSSRSGDVTNP